MQPWTNAEIHVYLDRDRHWRARVQMTVDGEPVQFVVPEPHEPVSDYAHGLVPLFLRLAEELGQSRKRKAGGR